MMSGLRWEVGMAGELGAEAINLGILTIMDLWRIPKLN